MSNAAIEETTAAPAAAGVEYLVTVRILPRPEDEIRRGALVLRLLAILKSIQRRRLDMDAQMERLIQAMMPREAIPFPPQILQARRNAAARNALLREFGAMTSAQVGENAGSKSPNRAALAHRWKSDGRIFAVPHEGTNVFPGFQFNDDGQPLDVIAQILRILAGKRTPWEIALWLISNNGWLGARRPVDLLREDPASVVTAAEREAEDRIF